MSGLYPNRTQVLKNDYTLGSYRVLNPGLAEHPSIGGFLRHHGYHSSRVSKIYHMGIPGGIERGDPGGDEPDSWDYTYDVFAPETHSPGVLELLSPKREHYGSNFARVIVPNGRETTQADVMAAAQAVAILENRVGAEQDRPFFLAVGFVRPHVPLVAPERLFDLYPEAAMELPFVPADDLSDVPEPGRGMQNLGRYGMNRLQQQQSIAGYYASVSFMDEQVGKLLSALDRLDLRKNTIVIFTSDHGYNLGEHECWQKLSLFEDSVRVPLIISAPMFADSAGKSSDAIVELVDLYPTVADLVGLGDEVPSILQGRSLHPLLEEPGRSDWGRAAAYTVTYRNGESIRTDRWRYNRWGPDLGEELYDHENDPGEFNNLADDGKYKDALVEMRRLLEATRARSLE
jgi:arylsulfatase A-like enzyme